jgi:SAM-dependent methyltransferase
VEQHQCEGNGVTGNDASIASFYAVGGGDRLVRSDVYPAHIRRYLVEELRLIEGILKSRRYSHMLEVGCMYGRMMHVATRHGVKYRGIDLVPAFIKVGRRRSREYACSEQHAKLWICSVNDIEYLVKRKCALFPEQMDDMLAVFPFNCFGNLAEPEDSLLSLNRCGCDVLICTYVTDANANRMRREYYDSCGYKGLEMVQNGKGVLFTAGDGLHSIAYHPHYVNSLLMNSGYARPDISFINPCGVSYHAVGRSGLCGNK